jgi:hypothetical protein
MSRLQNVVFPAGWAESAESDESGIRFEDRGKELQT